MKKTFSVFMIFGLLVLSSCSSSASYSQGAPVPEAEYTAAELSELMETSEDEMRGKVVKVTGRVEKVSESQISLDRESKLGYIYCNMSGNSNDFSGVSVNDYIEVVGTIKSEFGHVNMKDCYFIGTVEYTNSSEKSDDSVVEFHDGPTKEELIKEAQVQFETLTGQKNTYFSYKAADWEIDKTYSSYVLAGVISYAGARHDVIIKLEYNEDYSECTVSQIKIDGEEISIHGHVF